MELVRTVMIESRECVTIKKKKKRTGIEKAGIGYGYIGRGL